MVLRKIVKWAKYWWGPNRLDDFLSERIHPIWTVVFLIWMVLFTWSVAQIRQARMPPGRPPPMEEPEKTPEPWPRKQCTGYPPAEIVREGMQLLNAGYPGTEITSIRG